MTTPQRAADDRRRSGDVLKDWVRALQGIEHIRGSTETTLASVVLAAAESHGSAPALIGVNQQLTYAELGHQSNRYARWALQQRLGANSVVCLLMPNQPDYIAIWLGLTQVGCVVALLNTHLMADALAHCVRSSAATHVIVSEALIGVAHATMAQLPVEIRWWMHGDGASHMPRIDTAIADMDGGSFDPAERRPVAQDPALLIFTSGTTGLPKATNVSHGRVMEWSRWFAGMMDAQPSDRLFNCLPLYHSIGGVVSIGSMLVAGGSVVIRERFSVTGFWDDVVGTRCTILQYIGELCRYLLQSEPQTTETSHEIRLCCGNGLRGDVWSLFRYRFGMPRILEFYAATEGIVSLYNCEEKPGAIGRVPAFLAHRFQVPLIRCDINTGEPLRDESGRCVSCLVEEPGEAIGPLQTSGGSPLRVFNGYTDRTASARKIVYDVFESGDAWFRTGDLMRRDAMGFYYFVDRLGDTFRWRGENVSTTEVAALIGRCPGVIDVVVYGVVVPGAEGKAGMAALVVEDSFNLPGLRVHLREGFPDYAIPLFVRLCGEIETTETFKLKKTRLATESYAAAGQDAVWFNDRRQAAFVLCDADVIRQIRDGVLRL